MKKVLLLAAIGLIAAPAIADFQLGQVAGTKSLSYNLATGEMSATPSARIGSPIWATNVSTGYFFVIRDHSAAYPDDTYLNLDWGDIADGTEVGGFWFAYIGKGTSAAGPDTGTQVILFFGEENGFNSYMRTGLAGYLVTGLPDLGPAAPGGGYYGWLITVDLEPNLTFTITGSDLDGDTLTDWGWAQWVPYNDWVLPFMGPLIQAPSTTPGMVGTGSENVFDIYIAVSATDHNTFTYDGSYWFGGTPWAAFSMILYDTNGGGGCPQPGCDADLNGDCIVGLSDLGALLANYGATSGITHDGGDLEPTGGDGDVDLADLAVLLGQYGDDCN